MENGQKQLDLHFRKQVNLYKLQEHVDNLVTGASAKGSRFVLDEALIKALHTIGMRDLLPNADWPKMQPGQYREAPVRLTNSPHLPCDASDVPVYMKSLCEYVNRSWEERDLVHLSAYCMWRLNWIHPFPDGNGRTSRALSYLILCMRHGQLLPPKNSILEQIMRDKGPYNANLRQADVTYGKANSIDEALQPLEQMLAAYLTAQIKASFE